METIGLWGKDTTRSAHIETLHLLSSPRWHCTERDESTTSQDIATFYNSGPRSNSSRPEEKGKTKRGGNKKREKEEDEEKGTSSMATARAALSSVDTTSVRRRFRPSVVLMTDLGEPRQRVKPVVAPFPPHGAMQKWGKGATLGLPGRSPIPVLL
jgi:hypothetical protein